MINLPDERIEKATAKNETGKRAVLNSVHFDADTEILTAANGWIIAQVPVGADADTSGLVSQGAIKRARKKDTGIEAGESQQIVDEWIIPRPSGEYPNVSSVIDSCNLPDPDKIGPVMILNVELLHCLAQAICSEGLFVEIYLPREAMHPIVVRPIDGDGRGVIMPITASQRRIDGGNPHALTILSRLADAMAAGEGVDDDTRGDFLKLMGVNES